VDYRAAETERNNYLIRKATPSDIPAIVDLAVESVSIHPLPVKIDHEAMSDQAMQCLMPSHFLMVAEIDGKVVGAVAAFAGPSFWFRGQIVSVLLHYSRSSGQWVRLMTEFSRWVKSRSGIKMAIIELEPHHDERMTRFLIRLGFTRESRNMTFVRGYSHE
jgi:hypothetical protein